MFNFVKLLTLFLWSSILVSAKYTPPTPKVEPLYPKGLRLSIPDSAGISLVAYHVNINEDFDSGLEAGTIARDIPRSRNGRWTYQDLTTELKNGDVIYYWIHVVYNGLGYNLLFQQHRVSEFFNQDGSRADVISNEGNNDNCDVSETKVYDKSGEVLSKTICRNSLQFHEDFGNDNHLNESVWMINEQFSDAPDYEFVVYRNSPENIQLRNSKLKITPILLENTHGATFLREGTLHLEKCTGRPETAECRRTARGFNILPPVSSARVNTRPSFAFTYGRIIIRAKLPRGDWIYPLLTLEPLPRVTDYERNLDSKSERPIPMRVVSSTGNVVLRNADGRDISGHVIWGGTVIRNGIKQDEPIANYAFESGKSSRYSDNTWSRDFHDYELEWKPRQITVKVDDVQYDFKDVDFSLDKPYYINIGLAVGGLTEFPDKSNSTGYTKPWRNVGSKALYKFNKASNLWKRTWDNNENALEIDYVKVYAL